MFHSLRFRFALIYIALAVVPLIIVGAVIGARSYNTLEQQSLILQRKVAERAGSEIGAIIGQWENELVLLDEVYGLGALELKEQRAILSSTLIHQRAFQEIALLNSEGQEQIRLSRTSVIPGDDLQSRAGNEEFLFSATGGGTYLGQVRFDDTIREPLVTISVPIFNRFSGELAYVLVVESRFKAIWDLLDDLELASEEEVYVIDQAGLVVAHRRPAVVLSGTTIELPEVGGRAEGLSGTDVIVARHKLQLGNEELIVIAEQPVSRALELANKNLTVILSVICAALAFSVIFALVTTRRIVRPIEVLSTSARAISDGDFSQQLEVFSQDEVGQLASAFNQMTSNLVKSRKEIEQYTLELKANNKQLQREITERKQAEEKIQRAEALYRNMVELSPDGIYMSDMKGMITSCNEAATRILGYSKDELIGKHFTKLGTLRTSDTPKYLKILSAVLSGKVIEPQEVFFYHKNGTNHVVDIRTILLRLDGKKAIQITARDITEYKRMQEALQKAHDELEKRVEERTRELAKANKELHTEITERKRADEALRESEEEKSTLVEEAPIAISYVDIKGKITLVNKRFEEESGYSREEVVGKNAFKQDWFSEDTMKYLMQRMAARLRGKPAKHWEPQFKCKDGKWIWVDIEVKVIKKMWVPVGFQIISRNITERKRVDEELQKAVAELERSNAELERFAYIASHDLQEPLRMVASYTQLLEKRYKDRFDADANDFIGYAVDGAKRMQQLINDLLTYSRVGTRGKPFEPADCMTVFATAVANLTVAIRDSGAEVTSDPLPLVMADERQLVQLFQNLIGNAVKFHGTEPPRVHVSAEQSGDEWVFSVRDNGIGIDSQYLDQAFKVFQRLHGREYPGTGIGLSIAKRIVERHGGRIWLESHPGEGTIVYFTIQVKGGKQS